MDGWITLSIGSFFHSVTGVFNVLARSPEHIARGNGQHHTQQHQHYEKLLHTNLLFALLYSSLTWTDDYCPNFSIISLALSFPPSPKAKPRASAAPPRTAHNVLFSHLLLLPLAFPGGTLSPYDTYAGFQGVPAADSSSCSAVPKRARAKAWKGWAGFHVWIPLLESSLLTSGITDTISHSLYILPHSPDRIAPHHG